MSVNNTKFEKAYVLYANEKYFEIVSRCAKSIRTFSNIPIIVYLLNSDKKVLVDNTITINWDYKSYMEDSDYSIDESGNFYINRNSDKIYKLLINRPVIVKDALNKFSKVVCFVDSDSVATQFCDRIFDMYDPNLNYPYFVEGIYDYLHYNGRGGADTRDDLSTTLEHPACELFNVNQYVRDKYRQTGYFVASENCIDFLEEWYWMCNHPKIEKNVAYYAPFHEETILNVLLWKYNILDGLPYIYMNGTESTIDDLFGKNLFNGTLHQIGPWVKIPVSEENLLFVHGEKRPKVMDNMIEKLKNRSKGIDDNKLKVLFLAPHLSTGGMPSFLLKRIELIKKYSNDIDLYVVEYSKYSEEYVIQRNEIIKLLPENRFWSLGWFGGDEGEKMKLIDIIKENNIDIVHIEECPESFDPFNKIPKKVLDELYHNARKWRIVETCHNIWFDAKTMKVNRPDGYALCSPYHQKVNFLDEPSYSEVIEFPIENNFRTNEDKLKSQINLGLDPNKIHVLNVGLWTEGKNQREGVEIARLVEDSNPNIEFHFVGNQAPNFREYWIPIMGNLPKNVRVWGERDDVSEFMKASDVFMFNSTWECNPLVIREAISYGLKILSRNLPQYLDMFTPYIVEIGDDLNENKERLLNLIESENKYSLNPGQSITFVNKHLNFYNKIKSLPLISDFKKAFNIKINQHYVGNPFLEILGEPENTFKIEIYDDKDNLYYDNTLPANRWIKLNRTYFTKWRTKIWQENHLIYDNYLNYNNKRVYISFESSSLGDSIAWIPYCLEFKKKHNCHVIVSTFWNKLFKKSYPELEFVDPGVPVNNLHGMYKLGWFYNPDNEPVLPNIIPLQKAATNILGLDFEEIKPNLDFKKSIRPYRQKYVAIATNSTAGCKFWTKEGWEGLVEFLHKNGYRIINVSKEDNPMKHVEKIKDTSIENTMNIIYHSEFFVGLSSGLSWLSWALGKHVVMISNFTEPDHEFVSNCTRIINKNVCNGCWNKSEFKFDKGDWYWCPVHKGTDRQFECHTSITSDMLIDQIKHLIT